MRRENEAAARSGDPTAKLTQPQAAWCAFPLPTAEELRAKAQRYSTLLRARESGLLALVWAGQVVTAREIADALGISTQGATNHLMRLVHVGVLERDGIARLEGGREYAYRLASGSER
jgi:DNA-binding CsgD family transcriptional regulator